MQTNHMQKQITKSKQTQQSYSITTKYQLNNINTPRNNQYTNNPKQLTQNENKQTKQTLQKLL